MDETQKPTESAQRLFDRIKATLARGFDTATGWEWCETEDGPAWRARDTQQTHDGYLTFFEVDDEDGRSLLICGAARGGRVSFSELLPTERGYAEARPLLAAPTGVPRWN